MTFERAASAYGALGFACFPIVPQGKAPLCAHGERDATTNIAALARWGRRFPHANVGIPPARSGHFVVDVDVGRFGHESLAALPSLPATAITLTGGGGSHFWFVRPPELDGVRCAALRIDGVDASGIDIKGLSGGYVVVPPSIHPSGRPYFWEASSRIDEVPIAAPPDWLVAMILHAGRRAIARPRHDRSVDPESFYLGVLFKRAGLLGPEVRPGVFAVRCPTEHCHSGGAPFDSSTVIFAPRLGERSRRGTFFCAHTSHCAQEWR